MRRQRNSLIRGAIFFGFLALAILAASLSAKGATEKQQNPEGSSLTVMTFNIRTLALTDGRDFWTFRKDAVAALIREHSPDLIGLQEAWKLQAKDLERRLPGYRWFGLAREPGNRGERCPVFYKTDRLALLEHGTFWLSETPELPSRSWDAAFPRIVTWGKFRDKKTGKVFFFFNTHFDHQGVIARRKSAALLLEKAEAMKGELPAILAGDFNFTDDSEPYRILAARFLDARKASISAPRGPEGTTRGFKLNSQPGKRIDYVWVDPSVRVTAYAVLDETYKNGRRPSDHMPVLVRLALP